MNDRDWQISRRDALRMVLGVGAGLALGPRDLWTHEGGWDELEAASLVTKPIHSTGEPEPARPGYQSETRPAGRRSRPGGDGAVAEAAQGRQGGSDAAQLGGVNEMLPVLREWKDAGKTRYIGVTATSENQYPELERLLRTHRMEFIQVDYAIDNREVEQHILPLAQERGVAVLAALPFGRGRVFESLGNQPVPAWAQELGIRTWAQFALKYIVSHPAVTVAIPGTATMEYLTDNIGAARGRMAALVEAS